MPAKSNVPDKLVEESIHLIRGERVMLDEDLAKLYGVPVKRLNEQVRRNERKFPSDFMFRLTAEEFRNLRSQIATSSRGWGGRRYPPRAFTEHGAVMLATVLSSPAAIKMSIQVVKAFVAMREMLGTADNLQKKLDKLEQKMVDHDEKFAIVFQAIRQLMDSPKRKKKPSIGFRSGD